MQPATPASWVGHESVLRPSSGVAHHIADLFTFMVVISTAVYVLVIAAVIVAAYRARRGAVVLQTETDPLMRRAVTISTALTVLILFGYLAYDFSVGRAAAAPINASNALRISIVGHQWWWEVEYRDTAPQRLLVTANEIHVPVGRPVVFALTSQDVIHSFWIPNLNGKRDLIPGHPNEAWFQADTPGVYRGQCAEFCGLEHAKMVAIVIAQSPNDFAQWYSAQLAAASPPSDSLRAQGQKIFLSGSCAMCHAISGTPAGATLGPDLTHVGSRMTIAGGIISNTNTNLANWIADPQRIKPGSYMPPSRLSSSDMKALVAYLEGLR